MRRLVLGLAVLAAACGPVDPGPPYTARVFDWDAGAGAYALADVALPSLTALGGVEGALTRVRGEAGVEAPGLSAAGTFDARQLHTALTIAGGRPADLAWRLDGDTVVPLDAESVAMLSFYRSLERSEALRREVAPDLETGAAVDTLWQPEVDFALLVGPVDLDFTTGFHEALGVHLVFRRRDSARLPLLVNTGFGASMHLRALVHGLTAPANGGALEVVDRWPVPNQNAWAAARHGLALAWGALVTGDPNFLAPSVRAAAADDWDLSGPQPHSLSALEIEGADLDPTARAIAAALWSLEASWELRRIAEVLLTVVVSLAGRLGASFDLEQLGAELFYAVLPSERGAVCEAWARAALPAPPGCGG